MSNLTVVYWAVFLRTTPSPLVFFSRSDFGLDMSIRKKTPKLRRKAGRIRGLTGFWAVLGANIRFVLRSSSFDLMSCGFVAHQREGRTLSGQNFIVPLPTSDEELELTLTFFFSLSLSLSLSLSFSLWQQQPLIHLGTSCHKSNRESEGGPGFNLFHGQFFCSVCS